MNPLVKSFFATVLGVVFVVLLLAVLIPIVSGLARIVGPEALVGVFGTLVIFCTAWAFIHLIFFTERKF